MRQQKSSSSGIAPIFFKLSSLKQKQNVKYIHSDYQFPASTDGFYLALDSSNKIKILWLCTVGLGLIEQHSTVTEA